MIKVGYSLFCPRFLFTVVWGFFLSAKFNSAFKYIRWLVVKSKRICALQIDKNLTRLYNRVDFFNIKGGMYLFSHHDKISFQSSKKTELSTLTLYTKFYKNVQFHIILQNFRWFQISIKNMWQITSRKLRTSAHSLKQGSFGDCMIIVLIW